MTYSKTHKGAKGPQEITSHDSAVTWLKSRIKEVYQKRSSLDFASVTGSVGEARSAENGFLIRYGEAMGALLALRAAGVLREESFEPLKDELLGSIQPAIVKPAAAR